MENEIRNLTDSELLTLVNPSLAVMMGDYSVPELFNVAEEEALAIKGVGEAKVKVLMALKEIANRIIHRSKNSIKSVHSPRKAMEYFQFLASKPVEEVWVMLLDSKNHIIGSKMVSRGNLYASALGMREIFAPAIKRMAAAIVVAHNHPSGIASPSQEDIKITRDLVASSELLGIQIMDHVVIAKEGSVSLREAHSEIFNTGKDIF